MNELKCVFFTVCITALKLQMRKKTFLQSTRVIVPLVITCDQPNCPGFGSANFKVVWMPNLNLIETGAECVILKMLIFQANRQQGVKNSIGGWALHWGTCTNAKSAGSSDFYFTIIVLAFKLIYNVKNTSCAFTQYIFKPK